MFPVSRYDPGGTASPQHKGNKKRRRRSQSRRGREGEGPKTTVDGGDGGGAGDEIGGRGGLPRVIAPEQPDPSSSSARRRLRGLAPDDSTKLPPQTAAEAVDDLDLDLDLDLDPTDQTTEGKGAGDEARGTGEPPPSDPSQQSTSLYLSSAGVSVTSQDLERAREVAQRPLEQVSRRWELADFLVRNLQSQKVTHFFPIQAVAIPHLLLLARAGGGGLHGGGLHGCRDVCLAAPTGSGKTLSYVLPVLQALHETVPPHVPHLLRALVVLPSRDLARQVHQVFSDYVQGSNLTVGLAVGQSDFAAEQQALWSVGTDDAEDGRSEGVDWYDPASVLLARRRLALDPSNVSLALDAYGGCIDGDDYFRAAQSVHVGSRCGVDVLVCTPGRLVDHLDRGTFTLRHLRYLVVDEADRLLSQRYHDWIPKVLKAAEGELQCVDPREAGSLPVWDPNTLLLEPRTWRPSEAIARRRFGRSAVPLQKVLVSATLTRDPQKLGALQVQHPLHLHLQPGSSCGGPAEKRYVLPPRLDERMVECTAEQKPLALLALLLEGLHSVKGDSDDGGSSSAKMVVFTSSVDSTHRLTRLLQLLWAAGVADGMEHQPPKAAPTTRKNPVSEFSSATSSLPAEERAALLRESRIVVCSDGMSRGMDLSDVRCVFNYDVPTLAKTYVHRCGRTARAGQSGTAVTLLKKGQVAQFRRMRSLIVSAEGADGENDGSSVQSLTIPKTAQIQRAIPKYRHCLQALRRVLEAEDGGELGPADVESLPQYLSELLDGESE